MEGRPARLVILGDPVDHSLSPAFQNAALRSAGIPLRYEALKVAASDLESVARELAKTNSAGNVTVPHKQKFFALCQTLTPIARRAGAVNTFWTSGGALVGDNTDAEGFDRAVRTLTKSDALPTAIAVIGAGGAAAGVLGAIESWTGSGVRIFSRRVGQAAELALRFSAFSRAEMTPREALLGAKLVVNATPVGFNGDAVPFDISLLDPDAIVVDLVYNKASTPLVRAAVAAGHRAMDGTEMLLAQGAASFERWFGFAPDLAAMRSAIA
jgi:shikimate dehydrogenase